jgi:hypothetical protein
LSDNPLISDNDRKGVVIDPDRIVERNAGCWSCIHFISGEQVLRTFEGKDDSPEKTLERVKLTGRMYIKELEASAALLVSRYQSTGMSHEEAMIKVEQVKMTKAQEMVSKRLGPGFDPWEADQRVIDKRLLAMMIAKGLFGQCGGRGVDRAGNPVEDNIIQESYCCNRWTARTGMKPEGESLTPLADELLELADDKAKRRA